MGLRLFLVFFMLGCGATRPVSPDAGPTVAVDGGNALVDAGQAPVDGGSVSEDAGASPDPLKTCNSPLDCVLTKTSCCGYCDAPTLADAQGVNERQVQAMSTRLCEGEDIACPPCAGPPYPGHFIAACVANQCTAVDVHVGNQVDDRCETDGDCRVRGNTCCGNCGVADDEFNSFAVSVAGGQQIADLLCGDVVCEACGDPGPAPKVEAYCNEESRCRLRRVP